MLNPELSKLGSEFCSHDAKLPTLFFQKKKNNDLNKRLQAWSRNKINLIFISQKKPSKEDQITTNLLIC